MISVTIGNRIWMEDDATRGLDGHESLAEAWYIITGVPFKDAETLFILDHGDCIERVKRVGEKLFFVRSMPDVCEIYEAT